MAVGHLCAWELSALCANYCLCTMREQRFLRDLLSNFPLTTAAACRYHFVLTIWLSGEAGRGDTLPIMRGRESGPPRSERTRYLSRQPLLGDTLSSPPLSFRGLGNSWKRKSQNLYVSVTVRTTTRPEGFEVTSALVGTRKQRKVCPGTGNFQRLRQTMFAKVDSLATCFHLGDNEIPAY
ncbi:hypothetical protein J6590_038786 [Homalodisca vitripennis]|nr:hypothetical protein J6590_038786 [Homalodisca vitripennis]